MQPFNQGKQSNTFYQFWYFIVGANKKVYDYLKQVEVENIIIERESHGETIIEETDYVSYLEK
jgi:hypothetical protein